MVESIRRARAEGTDARARSRSSTASTPSRACSRRRCAPPTCPTRSSAATKFYERAEIKDALAYLRILLNPRSDVDLAARHQRAGARHRADDGRPAHRVGHDATTPRSSTPSRRLDDVGDLGAGGEEEARELSRAAREAQGGRDAAAERDRRARARGDRVHPGAREGRQRRERRAHREPARARELDAGLRGRGRGRRRATEPRGVPRARDAGERRGRAGRRRRTEGRRPTAAAWC